MAGGLLPDSVEDALRAASLHIDEGAWDQVAEMLREALESDPDEPYLLCWLGVAERELGMEGIAYERFKRALAVGSEDPVLLATAGNAVAAFDDPSAEPALRSAALLGPEVPQARWMYGAYLSREGMFEQALKELDAAVELAPEDSTIQLERGVAQALHGDLESAYSSFARSVELGPGDGWVLVLLGLTALQSGDLEASLGPLEEAARLRPEDLEAQLLAALALAAAGWEDRALEMLERGRFAVERQDSGLLDQAEGHIESGAQAAREFLEESLGPTSFRTRLMQRP